ncbi:dynein 1 light intermediate chain [Thraustotheca clavata]|uniref:Dynein light intermediate chain n=1 Tax=Thraustotheca clavata TaxID=74557 RepID=A0A1V9Z8Q0_9STRA|nr:dynein 1 light intermediate chain [Thraustotheca clavata]
MAKLWESLLRESSARAPLASSDVLLLGPAESGKSALLHRWQHMGNKSPNERGLGHPVLPSEFATFHLPSEEDPSCQMNIWSFNTDLLETEMALLSLAIDIERLKQTIALIIVDGSRPWTIQQTLDKWLPALDTAVQEKMLDMDDTTRNDYLEAIKKYWFSYEEPGQTSVPSLLPLNRVEEETAKLPEGVFVHNCGIPIVIITPDDTVKQDFIQYTIRQASLAYGATVCYTSSKTGDNTELLKNYIMHRTQPGVKFNEAPKLIDRNSIFVPCGFDSNELIEQSLVGSQPRWPKTQSFENFFPAPVEKNEDSALLHPEIRVDQNQTWLRKLEKAAGAGLADLQKSSVEASRRADELATARRLEADSRKDKHEAKKDTTKDVNPKHLANFFNNLLSRPEKHKAGRSASVLLDKTMKQPMKLKDIKELAEQELKKM